MKLSCKLGLHGPEWVGNEPALSSMRTAPFTRVCSHCGATWYGQETSTRTHRTVGGWKQFEKGKDGFDWEKYKEQTLKEDFATST